jgi:hypothetical protein
MMKNNKIKEAREYIHKTPPKNIKKILSQIELFEIYPRVFALVIKDDKLRARVFLRYQEFYESDSDTFRGKGFKWRDYIEFYKEKTKKDYFSYYEDFAGYNIPCDSIEACMKKIPDLNIYDMIMFSVVDTIRSIVGSDNFYLIGIDQNDGEDESLIHHEFAHALWFSDPDYKNKMMKAIESMDQKVRQSIYKKIGSIGYGENVFDDELQAYLSTGLIPEMTRIKDIKKEAYNFKSIFDNYTHKLKAKKIPIDWSTDLDQ